MEIDTLSHSSKAYGARPVGADGQPPINTVVLHYTAVSLEASVTALAGPNATVSAHYLVPVPTADKPQTVYQLVADKDCAWHAGLSEWQGKRRVNDYSIGIEMVGLGYTDGEKGRVWHPFPDAQIDLVTMLLKQICARYAIHPTRIVGHSDIAPGRKFDPGPLFPWKALADQGIGAWPDLQAVAAKRITANPDNVRKFQENLKQYGYAIDITGMSDKQTQVVAQAFQAHFRPTSCTGEIDQESCAIIESLLEKYRR